MEQQQCGVLRIYALGIRPVKLLEKCGFPDPAENFRVLHCMHTQRQNPTNTHCNSSHNEVEPPNHAEVKRPKTSVDDTLSKAQLIAESIVGPCSWSGAIAFISCPGKHLHTTASGAAECKVICERTDRIAPGIYCFHASCKRMLNNLNFNLRSQLGKRLQPTGGKGQQPVGMSPTPKFSPVVRMRLRLPEPEYDPVKLERVASRMSGVDSEWFAARSAVRPDIQTPSSFLRELYQERERVIIFENFRVQGSDLWGYSGLHERNIAHFQRGAKEGVWFLCNPVNGKKVVNDSGKGSFRSHLNVTSWRYMVVESDEADPALWMAALAQLPLRIASICESGGKSIHALVRLDAVSKQDWDSKAAKLKPALVTLGADSKAMSAVRLTRLACCERLGTRNKDGEYVRYAEPRMQTLLYLNGDPTDTPICDLPVNPEWRVGRRSMEREAIDTGRAHK